MAALPDLPDGWEEAFDPGSGRVRILTLNFPRSCFQFLVWFDWWPRGLRSKCCDILTRFAPRKPYFVNHGHKHTTFVDPRRLSEILLPQVSQNAHFPPISRLFFEF
jgi:hypothetical protein